MSEFKMSDYFDKPVKFDIDLCKINQQAHNVIEAKAINLDALCEAVNNHDRLVEENQRLTEIATKHATRSDELWEALECMLGQFGEPDGSDFINEADYLAVSKARKVLDRTKIDAVSNSNDD